MREDRFFVPDSKNSQRMFSLLVRVKRKKEGNKKKIYSVHIDNDDGMVACPPVRCSTVYLDREAYSDKSETKRYKVQRSREIRGTISWRAQ